LIGSASTQKEKTPLLKENSLYEKITIDPFKIIGNYKKYDNIIEV